MVAINVYNAGGVPATVSSVYVTTLTGKAVSRSSASPNSEFLVGSPDLNDTLPLELAPGEAADSLTGDIGIFDTSCITGGSTCLTGWNSACTSSSPCLVNVLTARGNTFSAEVPASATGTTIISSSLSTLEETSTSTATIGSTISTASATSSTVTGGFVAGTNSLEIYMDACAGGTSEPFSSMQACTTASTVYQGGEVILTITVSNLASQSLSVAVDFQAVATNGASVSPVSPDNSCGSGPSYVTATQTIASGSTSTYTCTFVASQGSTGGTVTFLGYATGSYPPPSYTTTTKTTSGTTVTSTSTSTTANEGSANSAEVVSNPEDIGNIAGSVTGPLVPIAFQYASEESTTFGPAAVVPSSSEYVIFQGKFENTANASVTILQYSFLLVARISQEEAYYIVPTVSGWTGTTEVSAYSCALGTNDAPTGTSCSTTFTNCTTEEDSCVPTGSTVTLDFATCAADESYTYWFWETSPGNVLCSNNDSALNNPEVVTMYCIILYDFYSGGSWHDLAQAIPMEGTYFSG